MESLIEKPELAGKLVEFLDAKTDEGFSWVVYDSDHPIAGSWDLHCFASQDQALEMEREYQQIFNWHLAVPINDLCFAIKKIEYSLNHNNMNRNSLEAFREEAKALKVPQKMIDAAEVLMEQNVPKIAVSVG